VQLNQLPTINSKLPREAAENCFYIVLGSTLECSPKGSHINSIALQPTSTDKKDWEFNWYLSTWVRTHKNSPRSYATISHLPKWPSPIWCSQNGANQVGGLQLVQGLFYVRIILEHNHICNIAINHLYYAIFLIVSPLLTVPLPLLATKPLSPLPVPVSPITVVHANSLHFHLLL